MSGDNEKTRRPSTEFTLESVFGSVEPSARPEDIEALIRDAKEEKAAQTIRELEETRPDPSCGSATTC
jgi:hypothetical protein